MLALEVIGLGDARQQRFDDCIGISQPPFANHSAGEVAFARFDDGNAARAQGLEIGLGRGVAPHIHVHCGGHDHGSGSREVECGEEIFGESVGKAGQGRRRCGCHQQRVNRLRHADVFHRRIQRRVGIELGEHFCNDLFARKRGEGQGTHKLLRSGGHNNLNANAAVLQASRNLSSLVCSDSARNSQCDFH